MPRYRDKRRWRSLRVFCCQAELVTEDDVSLCSKHGRMMLYLQVFYSEGV
jgi:hypothetical protein